MISEDLLSRGSGLLIAGAQERLTNMRITVVGCGAIGSNLAIGLAKIGCEQVTFYENDIVEESNYNNQIYSMDELGMHKTDALSKYMQKYSAVTKSWVYHKAFLKPDMILDTEVLILAVDSIKTRGELFEAFKYNDNLKVVLDGRIGRTISVSYAIDTTATVECDYYQKREIYPPNEAAQIPCTEKTFMAPCMFIGSYMIGALHAYANNKLAKYPLKFYMDHAYMNPQITPRNHELLLKSIA